LKREVCAGRNGDGVMLDRNCPFIEGVASTMLWHTSCWSSSSLSRDKEHHLTSVNYVVPPIGSAGAARTQGANNKDPNVQTTGAYGNAFELALDRVTNSDGTVTDALTYKSYQGQTNGSFSAASTTGKGADLSSAYATLFSAMQSEGNMPSESESQLKDAFGALEAKSSDGTIDATVSGGTMLVKAGGPTYFNGISADQNKFVDTIVDELTSQLQSRTA
jgi:hypothetical protein